MAYSYRFTNLEIPVKSYAVLTIVSLSELVDVEALVEGRVLDPATGGATEVVVVVHHPHFWHRVADLIGSLQGDGERGSVLQHIPTAHGRQNTLAAGSMAHNIQDTGFDLLSDTRPSA